MVVSPPFVFLQQVKGLLRLDFAVAAQNCWVRKGGAFTGEIRFSSLFCFDLSCFSVVEVQAHLILSRSLGGV